MKLVITVEGTDPTDLDFIRERCLGSVEDVIVENEERFDGEVWAALEIVDE